MSGQLDIARYIEATLQLAHDALGASRAAFYRVDAEQNLHDFTKSGVPDAFHRSYIDEMFLVDPLHARRLANRSCDVVSLADAADGAPAREVAEYARFLSSFAVVDTIEMMFREGSRVVAGLSVMWTTADRPPTAEHLSLAVSLHRYLQRTFPLQDADGRAAWRERAIRELGLSERELEVTELLCAGSTNSEIASRLQISIATVKTHILHIYQKCSVRNRSELINRMILRT